MTAEDPRLAELRELLQGGRLQVVLPDGERRLRDVLGAPVDVTIGVQGSVRVQAADGRQFELLSADRALIYRLMLGLEET